MGCVPGMLPMGDVVMPVGDCGVVWLDGCMGDVIKSASRAALVELPLVAADDVDTGAAGLAKSP